VAEQLQVPRKSVRLNFSRKIRLSSGKNNEKRVPSGIPSGPPGIFLEKKEVPAYRQLAGIRINLRHIYIRAGI
jgi:hypothetical protein